MNDTLQRYRDGEHRKVCTELTELGEAVRNKRVVDEAMAVAREAMNRIRHNLELLYDRLLEHGYEFAHPEKALTYARPETTATLERLEERFGPLPLSIRAWYETFESVNFEQATAQLRGETGPEPVQGLGSHPAMCIRPLDTADQESGAELGSSTESIYLLVGPELSNCGVAGVHCPNPLFDEPEFALDGRQDSSFIAFVRDCLNAGGFPFWAHTGGNIPDIICPVKPDYDELLPELTEGFRPF